ncbi:MAG: hypothetical protein GXP26_11955 [Planctomycetes bacterium]|nr:hypothetical protein [Planctomycetota bacterium]
MVCSASKTPVLDQALSLHERGIPLTLCRENKRPIGKDWQHQEYDADTIESEFDNDPDLSIGIVLGARSGIVDFEGDDDSSEADILELFDGNIPKTPSFRSRRGIHRLFAWDQSLDRIGSAVTKFKTVEVRLGANGKAAHSLVPPSMTDGVEREWIVSFEDCEPAEIPESVLRKLMPPAKPRKVVAGKKGRPGDDYNQNGPSWSDILTPHGWSLAGNDGQGVDCFSRPGKSEGTSATAGHCKSDDGHDLLYVFSTNAAPFEGEHAYSKFAAHTLLNHGGDFSAAAADLVGQGLGKAETKRSGTNEATRLTNLIVEAKGTELFHSPDAVAFATVEVDGHKENVDVSSSRFKSFISRQFFCEHGRSPSRKSLSEAIGTLTGMALFDGSELPTELRVASKDGAIYIDRGSVAWDAVKVSAAGYEIVAQPPVKFWRSGGMCELPLPVSGGNIDMLRELVNVRDEQFPLLVGSMVSYLSPSGPYPTTIITGEKGSAKSTLARLQRSFCDPSTVPLRCEPKDIRSLMVNARNNWAVTMDNVSKLPHWLSDSLCRLSTGGGFSDRALYTNGDEFLMSAQRPVIMTSIADVATRPDLLDRSLVLELEAISTGSRITEAEYWLEVELLRPQIFGALLEALSVALRRLPNIQLVDLPRMADFAKLVTAAEPALRMADGDFMTAYRGNQEDVRSTLLESVVAQAVVSLVDQVGHWKDSPAKTCEKLATFCDEKSSDDWPRGLNALGKELVELAPALRESGYLFSSSRSNGNRFYELSKA